MKIIYASCLCSKQVHNNLFSDNKHKVDQQVQKYHRLLVEGFALNGISVITVSAPPVNSSNTNQKTINLDSEIQNGVKYTYLPTINIPALKNVWTVIRSFFRTLNLCIKYEDSVIICDILNVSVSTGALLASRVANKPSIGIVTDLPSMLNKAPNNWKVKFNNFLVNSFNAYLFLTEQMNTLLNKKNKPYIVIEGQVDINMQDQSNNLKDKYQQKVCLYAGGLQKKYGLKLLAEAFVKARVENTELHLYGSGDYEIELEDLCKSHPNVKYFGIVPNDYVVNEQLKATLLINPRPTNEDYTKYSFPSKNMEYMASGTPVLTTALPGMPKEYSDYVYIINEETEEGLIITLRNLLSKDKMELHDKGKVAKEFVIKKKNNVIQVEKILEMIKKVLN